MSSFGRNDLSDPSLRVAVTRLLRRKLPAQEVDDAVQTVLTEALAAPEIPDTREAASRWLLGIARHKAVDFFRKRRELPTDEVPAAAVQMDHEERDFVRFMLAEVSGDQSPLVDVLLREADGEKLEHLAAEAGIAAPTLRQRVSRLRRFLREKRALELALVAAALVALAFAFARYRAGKPKLLPEILAPQIDSPIARARELRDEAERSCNNAAWKECIDQLDEAKKLDGAGEDTAKTKALRDKATRELNPPPEVPKPAPNVVDSAQPTKDLSGPSAQPSGRPLLPRQPDRVKGPEAAVKPPSDSKMGPSLASDSTAAPALDSTAAPSKPTSKPPEGRGAGSNGDKSDVKNPPTKGRKAPK